MSYQTKAEHFILSSLFGNAPEGEVPTTWYIGALRSNLLEPEDSSYSRVAITNVPANFSTKVSVDDQTTIRLKPAVTFSSAAVAWDPITTIGFYDAPTNGNLWLIGTLNQPATIAALETLSFDPETILLIQR